MSGREKDWLVDGGGEPDAFERGVEESLRGARWESDVEALVARLERTSSGTESAEGAPAPTRSRRGRAARREPRPSPTALVARWRPLMLAAAGVALVAGAWAVLAPRGGSAWERASGGAWRIGAWVETGDATEEFAASSVGRVTVGPGSRVRLLAAQDDEHRLELAQGSLEAFIYAPPRLFFVETPGATAVDMGCAYELDVAEDGSGMLRVTGGWVELEAKDGSGLVSRVPAGAVCAIGADGVPGVPRFEDAGAGFAGALEQFTAGDPDALPSVLEAARARDSLTVWHLVSRTSGAERAAAVDRLLALAPADRVREGAMALDADAMDTWWREVRRAW